MNYIMELRAIKGTSPKHPELKPTTLGNALTARATVRKTILGLLDLADEDGVTPLVVDLKECLPGPSIQHSPIHLPLIMSDGLVLVVYEEDYTGPTLDSLIAWD